MLKNEVSCAHHYRPMGLVANTEGQVSLRLLVSKLDFDKMESLDLRKRF